MIVENFNKFIFDVGEKLKQPLPGEKAQLLLEPSSRRKFPPLTNAGDARQSSVLLLFYPEKDEPSLVFIQRNEYDGVHSGQVAFPGGGREPDDLSPEDTALRETREEIGIHPEKVKLIGRLTQLYIPPSNFIVHPFVGFMNEKPVFFPDPNEVSQVFAVKMSVLLNDSSRQEREIEIRNYQLKVPCFYVNKKVIWGATSMILSELIEVIRQRE
jgi:8-oxo-dGTP pyrophosphatase MutT (NUDIX family)